MSDEIILSCPGGKCPIKISCVTHLRKDATAAMPVPPFSQHGIVITCTYFKIKEYEQRLPATTTAAEATTEETKIEQDKIVERKEVRATEVVAAGQGQLFT
jgi:hypothetical protein